MIKQLATNLLISTAIAISWQNVLAAEENSIVVTGRVVNIPENGSRTIIINECDISDKSERRIVELDSVGGFDERIPLAYGHTFTVNYNRSIFITMYAEPGDSIDLFLDASESPVAFHVAGDRAQLNEELAHVNRDLVPLLYDVRLLPDTAGLTTYMAQFRQELDRVNAGAKEYFEQNNVSGEVAALMNRELLYGMANMAIGYMGRGVEDRRKFFTDSIFDLTDTDNTKVMIFPYHLGALMLAYPEYIDSVPRGLVRDLMYVTGVNNGSLSERPERSDFTIKSYYDRIFGNQTASTDIIEGPMPTGDLLVYRGDSLQAIENVDLMAWLTEEYPQQPIYLDVSATWCGPCRASLAHSEGLREHFKDSDVRFVILWLRSDKDSWRKLIPTIHNAVHIFVENEDLGNLLIDKLKVSFFPSYRFRKPDGSLIYESVPGFGSGDLPEFLKKYTPSHRQ